LTALPFLNTDHPAAHRPFQGRTVDDVLRGRHLPARRTNRDLPAAVVCDPGSGVIPGKVAVILQARAASTRLPARVLASRTGPSVLAHCVSRLKASGVGLVIVTTTTLPADDAVVAESKRLGVTPFRGDSDVLSIEQPPKRWSCSRAARASWTLCGSSTTIRSPKLVVLEAPSVIVDRVLAYRRRFSVSGAAGLCGGEDQATHSRRLDVGSLLRAPLAVTLILVGQAIEGGNVRTLVQLAAARSRSPEG
jgi:hypothetical protein